ncbi:lonely Cys domain-containing protein [Streptomyces fulvoviolaceus]|uniref:lonely Cys domain-containing protein n=1 Tax=Streptomyces fulvoviolaceus TaxID=285535 RepID=UPI0021C20723|nr:lonely Cys domain-containing protein [Streptomyces fulvoviolaceus]MCT9084362.1 lonely Cys domain-containing protein [Streptomyces fulvoviolaceus]
MEGLHPWSVPAAASIARWAALTAVRHRTPPTLDRTAPPHVSGLHFTTRAGLRYDHFTGANMLRPNIEDLLKHTYEVQVGNEKVLVGLDLDSAEILGPPVGTVIKQRRYAQQDEEPKHESERAKGWNVSFGPELGGEVGHDTLINRTPVTVKSWVDGDKRSSAMGDTDERNKEGQRPYRNYRFDVSVVVKGPYGTVRMKVPGGLYGMLPVAPDTGRLADGLEGKILVRSLLAPPSLVRPTREDGSGPLFPPSSEPTTAVPVVTTTPVVPTVTTEEPVVADIIPVVKRDEATRRIWDQAYADFASETPDTDPETVRRAWDDAVGMVMPPQSHPVLADSRYADSRYADSRYAGEGFRDAVRDVAELLVANVTRDYAQVRADRLRQDLGLPPREPGDPFETTDTTPDPFARQWPIGHRLTVGGPRRGGQTEVPARDAPASPSTGKGKQRERWFTYRRAGVDSQYEVSSGGEIELPSVDGTPPRTLSPDGWVRYGDDFVHAPTPDAPDGAFLRGDSGWLGTFADPDGQWYRMAALDPAPVPYTLVVDPAGTHLYLVPDKTAGASGADSDTAVRIPLADTTGDVPVVLFPEADPDRPHEQPADEVTARAGQVDPPAPPPAPRVPTASTSVTPAPVSAPVSSESSDTAVEEDVPLPAPPAPGQGSSRVPRVLRGVFGSGVADIPADHPERYEVMLRGLAALEHARGDRRIHRAEDMERIARRILHLRGSVEMTRALYFDALSVAADAYQDGRADSLFAVAAYQLGWALGDASAMAGWDGTFLGRNWTGQALNLLVDFVGRYDRGGLDWSPPPWQGSPYVVVVELSDAGLIMVRDGAGNQVEVPYEELAELVAHDPWRPPGAPVVLLLEDAGAGMRMLPSLVAERIGGRVWSMYGSLRLQPMADNPPWRRVAFAESDPPGAYPVGAWIPSNPGQVPAGPLGEVRASDGTTFSDDDVEMYTLTTSDGQRLTGLVLMNATEMALREVDLRNVSQIQHYADQSEYLPGISTSRTGPLLPLPRGLNEAVVVLAHGRDGSASLPRRSTGETYTLSNDEMAAFLARQIALLSVPAHWPVWAVSCQLGRWPTGADPLEQVPGASVVATRNARTVFTSDANQDVIGDTNPPYLIKSDDPDDPVYHYLEFPPEPGPDALSAWADNAGLPGNLADRTTRVLRWVRAMRQLHGVDIDTNPALNPEFQLLLQGFGALERQAVESRMGPLTWAELARVAAAFAAPAGWDTSLSPALLGQLLAAYRAAEPQPHAAPPAPGSGAAGTAAAVSEAPVSEGVPQPGPVAGRRLPSAVVAGEVAGPVREFEARLLGMGREDRFRAVSLLSPEKRRNLVSDPVSVDGLRRGLSAEEFAETAAQLMVVVQDGSGEPMPDQPVSAREAARARVARLLVNPGVAASLLKSGMRVVVVPRDVAMTALSAFRHLTGKQIAKGDTRTWDTQRGSSGRRAITVPEENLLGEDTSVPDAHAYEDGYSTTDHEVAHAIHLHVLDDADRKVIRDSYLAKRNPPPGVDPLDVEWPDGIRRNLAGKATDNYSSMNESEYFAQAVNAYLGSNAGTDEYTGRPRNNGAAWVRQHEPALLPILERLFGTDPQDPGPANPVERTRAEHEFWEGFRAFWDEVEGVYRPQPHALAPVGPIAPVGPVAPETQHTATATAPAPGGERPDTSPDTSDTDTSVDMSIDTSTDLSRDLSGDLSGEEDVPLPAPPAPAPAPTSPAPTLSVTAAVPVPAPARPHVDFLNMGKDLDGEQLPKIDALAKAIVADGLRDLAAGLGAPQATVTGYGNGPRFAIGSGAVRQARETGLHRAEAVVHALRAAIGRELAASGPALAAARARRGREIDVDDFPVVALSGGRAVPVGGPAAGRTERRRAVIDVERSPLSGAVDTLERLFPKLDLVGPQPSSQSLEQIADLVLLRPHFAPAAVQNPAPPSPPGGTPATAVSFTTDAVPDNLRALYDLVAAATAAGQAASPAALTAFHLSRQGLFADDTLLTAPDGTARGRQWTDQAGREVDTALFHVVSLRSSSSTSKPAPWAGGPGTPDPWVVATAGGDDTKAEPALPDGRRWQVSPEVLAELLAIDPVLRRAAPAVNVVLVSPKAADMDGALPGLGAFRARRTVWAHTGTPVLGKDPATSRRRVNVLDDRDTDVSLGTWVRSEPDDWANAGRTRTPVELLLTDGTTVRSDRIRSVTIPFDGRSTGRIAMGPADQFLREGAFAGPEGFTEWHAVDPVTNKSVGAARPVPWKGRRPYFLWAHMRPGRTGVVDTGSRLRRLTGPSTGRYLRTRPSLERLGQDVPIVLIGCWADALASEEPVTGDSPTAFVADPLAVTSVAEDVADDNQRTVFSPTRTHVYNNKGGNWRHGVYTSALGDLADWTESRPRPDENDLDALARVAGLDSLGIDAQERRDTVLRLVRAVRRTFGVRAEDDRNAHRALLSGLGALEILRRRDPDHAGSGAFTLDLLERVTWAHTGQRPAAGSPLPPSPDPDAVRATLQAARAAVDADGTADLSAFVSLPAVDRARELLATIDLDVRARQVLGIPPGRSVTPADRQWLLWATVRAVEAVDNHPDAETLTRQALHLPTGEDPRHPAHQEALLWTAAGAAGVGRDVHSATALAAYDLQLHGAFDDSTLVVSTSGKHVGRNWSPHTYPGRFDIERYFVADPIGTGPLPVHPTPWTKGPDRGNPYVLVLGPGAAPDQLTMPWPGRTTRPVPYAEIAELVRHDPLMRGMAVVSAVRIIPLGLGAVPRELSRTLASRTGAGRQLIAPRRPLDLRHDRSTNTTLLEMTTLSPDRGSDWTYARPKLLAPPPAPAPRPSPQPVTVPVITSTDTSDPRQPDATEPTEPIEPTELTLRQTAGGGDWLAGALADALKAGTPAGPHHPSALAASLSSPDPADALHRWVEDRLGEPGAERHVPHLGADDWAGTRKVLTIGELGELGALGVELTGDQLAYATLAGGLPPGEVPLSLTQRYRLLRRWADRAATVTEIAATLAATGLGIRLTIVEPDGTVRHFDPAPADEPAAVRR